MDPAFLIVGTSGSGLTLVAELVRQIPGVGVAPDTGFFADFLPRLLARRTFPLIGNDLRSEVDSFVEVAASRGVEIESELLVDRLGARCDRASDLYGAIVRQLADDRTLCGEVSAGNLIYWRALTKLLSDVKIVGVVRDPRGALLSNLASTAFQNGHGRRLETHNTVALLAERWSFEQQRLWETWLALGPDRCVIIRYEKILDDLEDARSTLDAFISGISGPSKSQHPSEERAILTPSPQAPPIARASVDRQVLSSASRSELRLATAVCRRHMSLLGYGDDAPSRLAAFGSLALAGPRSWNHRRFLRRRLERRAKNLELLLGRPIRRSPSGRRPTLISVVIPVRNAVDTLPQQLAALASQKYDGRWEVVIADNGSTDGTKDILTSWGGRLCRLRLVDASGQSGVSHARNVGARAAQGDFIVFCDGDDVVQATWLEAMADAARFGDIVGGALDRDALNSSVVQSWRPAVSKPTLPIFTNFLPFAAGCNLGAWTSVFRTLGGFDERFEGGCDDVEFCWRAQLASYNLVYAPEAIIQYRYRASLRSLARQIYRYSVTQPALFRHYRNRGMPRSDPVAAILSWGGTILRISDLLVPRKRGAWVRRAAGQWGRLAGSIQNRVMFL